MGNTVKWVTQGTKSHPFKKKIALFLPSSSCLATTVHLDQSESQLGTTEPRPGRQDTQGLVCGVRMVGGGVGMASQWLLSEAT